jgi:hypothetical protein
MVPMRFDLPNYKNKKGRSHDEPRRKLNEVKNL